MIERTPQDEERQKAQPAETGESAVVKAEPKEEQPNNPLHGITLEKIVTRLVDELGWIEMNRRIKINCFYSHPSVKSSLKFLRQTEWARTQVENLYLEVMYSKELKEKNAPDKPGR